MRFWLHSTARTPLLGQSSILSIAAHAVLIGAAVYATGVNARELIDEIAERIAYLPPPDRKPASAPSTERVRFVDVGVLNPGEGTSVVNAKPATPAGTIEAPRHGADIVVDDVPSRASIPVESTDSVYSILEVEQGASRLPGSAAPIYPSELIKDGKEGGVFMRFIVDTSGHADPGSMEVVRSTHPLFVASVKTAIPLMAFRPATIGGRPMRQTVEQNFEFKITQPATALERKASERRPVRPTP